MFATLPALQSSAQQSPPAGAKVAPLPDLKPGSWWVYKDANGERKWELKRVEGGKFFVQVEGVDREFVYTNEWNQIEGRNQRGVWVTFSPHLYSYAFPLWQGAKWKSQYSVRAQDFVELGDVWGEAKRWETAKVPAGTFQALKVEVERVFGTSVRRMTDKSTCWYAVEVQNAIKCEGSFSGTFELVRYELK